MDSYKKSILLKAPLGKVYQAITTKEGISNWWTKTVDAEGKRITVRFSNDTYAVLQAEILIENKEAGFRCSEQYFKTEGSDITNEWVGTVIWFRLSDKDGSVILNFEHEGLTPKLNCYKDCKNGWDYYLESLRKYLEQGLGTPFGM